MIVILPKPDNRVRLTFLDRKGERVVDAFVTWTEERPDCQLYFGYQPTGPDRHKHCTWGCVKLFDEPRPFGLQRVEILS